MTLRLPAAAIALAIAVVVVVVVNSAAPREGGLELVSAQGPLAMLNSAPDSAILVARGMSPGSSASGSVRLVNRSGTSAQLFLESSRPRESPGPGRGSLGAVLRLSVRDSAGREVVAGALAALAGCHDLGTIGAREARVYRFVASFPRGGAGDNAYARSATSVDERWLVAQPGGGCRAVAAEPAPARLVISHRHVALVRGHALFRVICRGPAGGRCAGTLTVRPARGASRLATGSAYGRRRFDVAAGRATTVRIRAVLRGRRKAIASAIVSSAGRVSARRVTLIRH